MESLLVQLHNLIYSCWSQRIEEEWGRTNKATLSILTDREMMTMQINHLFWDSLP